MPPSALDQDEIIAIQPSRILFWWIVFLATAATGLACAYLPLWYGVLPAVGCAVFAIYAINYHARLKRPESVVAIRYGPLGIAIQQPNGTWQGAPDTPFVVTGFVSPELVIIGLSSKQVPTQHAVVLLRDSLNAAAARRLRAWLRWARDTVPGSVIE